LERSKTLQLQRGPARHADYVIFPDPADVHPRMAWIYRVDQGRHPPRAGNAVSTKVDTHQEQWTTVEGGVGPVAGA